MLHLTSSTVKSLYLKCHTWLYNCSCGIWISFFIASFEVEILRYLFFVLFPIVWICPAVVLDAMMITCQLHFDFTAENGTREAGEARTQGMQYTISLSIELGSILLYSIQCCRKRLCSLFTGRLNTTRLLAVSI